MANQQVIISVLADVSKFAKRMRGLGSQFAAFARSAMQATALVGTALAAVGLSAIKAAEDSQTATKRLDNIAASMGLFGEKTAQVTERLKDYASKQQFATGVDDEAIMAVQAKLMTFAELAKTADKVGGAFDRATAATLDLAAAGLGNAETSAIQLGKALNDPVKGITALAKAGVTFTTAEKKKIKALVESGKLLKAQDIVLSAIETQVGGTAEATVKSSDRIRIAFGEISEAIGTQLLPYVDKIATAFVEWLNSDDGKTFFNNLQNAVDGFVKFWSDVWNSAEVQNGVQYLFDEVKKFTDYLNSDEGKKDVAEFRDFVSKAFGTMLIAINFTIGALKLFFETVKAINKWFKSADGQAWIKHMSLGDNVNFQLPKVSDPSNPFYIGPSKAPSMSPQGLAPVTVNVTGLTPTATIGRTVLEAVNTANRLGVR